MSHTQYKKQNIKIWNEMAPRYHKRISELSRGPWKSTLRLVELLHIKKGDRILDVACGTGAVTQRVSGMIGSRGLVVGIDTSLAAIKIAKRTNTAVNAHLVNGDAERFVMHEKFDAVTCQYALFFFPNSQRALKNMAKSLKKTGMLGITVHGNNTPYYSSIADVVTQFIPDYIPKGSARLDRFGTIPKLEEEIKKADFQKIRIKEFVFSYSPGTFDDYWKRYQRYASVLIKEKLGALDRRSRKEIRIQIREKTAPFTKKGGRIVFPWQVLIATAKPSV